MNFLQNFKNEEDFDKHLRNKYIESIKLMQKELNTTSNTNHFYINKSTLPNSGNGLFTNKSFNKGDIVCYYPPVIIYDQDEQNIIHDLDNFDVKKLKYYLSSDYVFSNFNVDIIAIKDTEIKNNMYLGHLMNDNNYNPHKIYTNGKNNCSFFLNSFELTTDSFKNNKAQVIKATKNINPGDELFISYGKNYWYDPLIEGNISRHLKIKKSLSK